MIKILRIINAVTFKLFGFGISSGGGVVSRKQLDAISRDIGEVPIFIRTGGADDPRWNELPMPKRDDVDDYGA